MPELPEVEVTRLGISCHLVGDRVAGIAIRIPKLRSMVPAELGTLIAGQRIEKVERRGKYLILECQAGWLLLHLGMTGHLRVLPGDRKPGPHDHLDLLLHSGVVLRLNDPRRFGSVQWTTADPLQHRLLSGLGPEPLTDSFTGDYLYRRSRGKKVALQRFIMDGAVVAGVGNIYAAESLFRCRLHPETPAGALTPELCQRLAAAIKEVLAASIAAGRACMDFTSDSGRLAYYPQTLYVYGREHRPCRECGSTVVRGRLGNRSTFFCPGCQQAA